MTRHVLDVGNCNYDHQAIAKLVLSEFDVEVARAHTIAEAVSEMEKRTFDLVLVNRILDRDGSEGLGLIELMHHDPRWKDLPVMMITNHADDQQRAVEAGAVPGFGKASLHDPATVGTLAAYLAADRL